MTFLTRRPALAVFFSIALFVAGGGTALFGFTAIGYDEPLHVVAGAIVAGAVMIAASIALTITTERRLRAAEKEASAERGESPAPPPARTKQKRTSVRRDTVLGQWTLAPDEWRAFVEQEAARQRRCAWEPALIGAAFGAVVPWIITGQWRYSAAGAALGGLVVLVAILIYAARMRTRVPQAGGGVVIRRNAVEIDGVVGRLHDEHQWLSGAKLLADQPLPILELTVSTASSDRIGRYRPRTVVVRVPVPRAREADARRICDQLKRDIAVEDEV